jgi:hypothetical protein
MKLRVRIISHPSANPVMPLFSLLTKFMKYPRVNLARGPVPVNCCTYWLPGSLLAHPADFEPEYGGGTFLRNVGLYAEYTALYLRKW